MSTGNRSPRETLGLAPIPAPPSAEIEQYFSDSDEFSEDDHYNPGLDTDLQDIGNSTLKYLNYTIDYVWEWRRPEGYREIYQNWRDGMLRSFKISPGDFRTETVEDQKKRLILIKAFAANDNILRGFIRFQYDKDGYCVGGLKIANFKATLSFRSLGTGATSKATDAQQTGQHGEGMKLSALVFRRNNYNFRIESGAFKWNFIFKKGELACSLRRIKDTTLEKLKQKEQGKPRSDVAHPWEDVCVVIGAPGNCRTAYGTKVKAKRLHIDEFREMLKVTLDVNPPKKMIHTPHGDLIRDPTYQGKMFLRGLLLPSGGMSGKRYMYGYNFVDGTTTRDRDTLAGSGEESERIAKIWASAIEADSSDDSDLLTEYTNLLLNSLNKKGDAILSSEENCLTENIATKIWAKMRTMNHNQQGRPAFYYSAIEGKDEAHIVEQSLNKNPIPLDLEMWNMLRKYDLCRTPGEELLYRFKYAKTVSIPSHSFAMHVDKMLRYLLECSPAMKGMEVTFVDGESLQIDAGFFGSTWRVHNKWLTYDRAHEHAYCDELASDDQKAFVCDHVVLQLWDIMISQLMASGDHASVAEEEGWLKSMARARLSQMPRAVECSTTARRGELHVHWESVDSHRNKDKEIQIVLHVEGCTAVPATLVQPGADVQSPNETDPECTCPRQFSNAVSDGVTFGDLDPKTNYIPSVSQSSPGALIALQPKSIKPLSENWSLTPPPEKESTIPVSVDITFPVSSVEDQDGSSYGESMRQPDDSDDEVDAGNNTIHRPSTPAVSSRSLRSAGMSNGVDTSNGDPPRSQTRVPIAVTISAAPPRKATHDQGVQTSVGASAGGELYVLGNQIEHRSLDWGGTFPGSHVFYRTHDTVDQEVFILKPKQQLIHHPEKRKAIDDLPVPEARRRHLQAFVRNESEELSQRVFSLPRHSNSPLSTTSEAPLSTAEREASSGTRGAAQSTTSVPPGGFRYRY